MTRSSGPPPSGVPPDVAKYLEDAAQRLSDVIEEFRLEPRPYEQHAPGRNLWQYSFYGTFKGRYVCIRIVTEKTKTAALATRIICYLRSYASLEANDWMTYESQPVNGLDYLVSIVRKMAAELKRLCEQMPFPSRPDAKA